MVERYFEELRERLGGFEPGRSTTATPDEMEPPHGAFLVMYEDGVPVGCGGVKRCDADTGEIKRMYVARAARGRGHGRRILEALERAAADLGRRRLVLDTAAPLTEARGLYEAAGYRPIPAYNENPYAAFWYAKELATGAGEAESARVAILLR
ncbi:MAG: GNAT family N-acetyltransferase [Planctomycetes bacterium]|nr:GNAT family N-acetyltransferase [Planctomycetota bacterium]